MTTKTQEEHTVDLEQLNARAVRVFELRDTPQDNAAFEHLLLENRDRAAIRCSHLSGPQINDPHRQYDDESPELAAARRMWYATEVALGLFVEGYYLPKREAREQFIARFSEDA